MSGEKCRPVEVVVNGEPVSVHDVDHDCSSHQRAWKRRWRVELRQSIQALAGVVSHPTRCARGDLGVALRHVGWAIWEPWVNSVVGGSVIRARCRVLGHTWVTTYDGWTFQPSGSSCSRCHEIGDPSLTAQEPIPLKCECGGLLAAATAVCTVCGADPYGYYLDDDEEDAAAAYVDVEACDYFDGIGPCRLAAGHDGPHVPLF